MKKQAKKKSNASDRGATELIVLGCGTSTGVPLISCECAVCRSKNPKNKRLRASVWVKTQGKSILIDTSSDLRQQALREKIRHVDFVLYTHPHADHIGGIDEMRAFNFIQKARIPCYGNDWTVRDLESRYSYIFRPAAHIEGGGIPLMDIHPIDAKESTLLVQGVRIVPLSTMHGSMECVGYRIEDVAYVTDCSIIPEETQTRMQGLKLLVLDCLRLTPHGTHFHLDQALEMIERLQPKETILTHLGHDFDYTAWSKKGKLPRGVSLAYDGLRKKIT